LHIARTENWQEGSHPAMSDPNSTQKPRLLRCSDAAHYLGVGKKRIRELIARKELPCVQLQPGNSPFLLDVRDLDRFVEARKQRTG
jgi:excisionase family DNA binding protein